MRNVKNLICAVTVLLGMLLVFTSQQVEAKDVWVDRWSSEGIDVYVMDDTLSSGTNSTGRWFSISTKMVVGSYHMELHQIPDGYVALPDQYHGSEP